jgi:hypothetical protein
MGLWAYIIGLKKFADAWPTGEGKPFFWGGAKVAFLNYSLLGYRKVAIKDLPWKALVTWGFASILVSPSLLPYLVMGQVGTFLQIGIISLIMVPFVVLGMWGLGRIFGAVFNRSKVAAA